MPQDKSTCVAGSASDDRLKRGFLIAPPCELKHLFGTRHTSAFLCSVAFGSACRKAVPTKAVGLPPGTSDPTHPVDRCCPTQPRLQVQVLLLEVSSGHRQTRDIDRMASARVQAVMEVEVAPGQTVPYQRRTNRLSTYGAQGNRLLEDYPVRCRVRLGVLPRLKTSRSRLASTSSRVAS